MAARPEAPFGRGQGVWQTRAMSPAEPSPRARIGRRLALPLALACASLAPLVPAWVRGFTLADRDTAGILAPARHLVGEALRHGRLPLWNPYAATGMPLFAEAIHGVLHPISILAAVLFPSDGIDPLVGMYLVCAAWGAALLARELGASRAGAAAAAFAYALSGFTVSMAAYLTYLAGAASLPWLVAGVRAAGVRRTAGAFAAGALGVAVTAFSGDVQALAFGTALGLFLALVERPRARGVARAALAVATGLAVAAVQLVPSWVHLGRTDRVLVSLDAAGWSLAPARLVELVVPGFFARPGAGLDAPVFRALGRTAVYAVPFAWSVYLGMAIVALAVVGAARWRGPAVAGVAFLWLALGRALGAQQVLGLVPIVGHLRFAEKHVGPLALCVAVLAGRGVDALGEDGRTRRRLLAVAGAALAALAAVRLALAAPAAVAWLGAAGVPAAGAVRDDLAAGLLHPLAELAALLAVVAALPRLGARPGAAVLALLVWASGATAVRYAVRPGPSAARLGVPGPPIAGGEAVPRVQNVPPAVEAPPRSLVSGPGWTARDRSAFAFAASAAPDANVGQRLDNLEVDTGLHPLRHLAAREAFGPEWAIAGRRYAVTDLVVRPPRTEQERAALVPVLAGATPEGEDPRTGAQLWRIPHRAWAGFPERVETVPGPEEAEDRLAALVRVRSRACVVECAGPLPVAPGVVRAVERGPEALRVEAEAAADSVLVVNDAWWPGWRATLDGHEVPIWPADLLVRAVPWPAGRHVLVMRYAPDEVRWGGWGTAAGVAALAAAVLVLRRRRPAS